MRQKLLLADDSITVQRVIELTLADEGLEVLTVGDGQQAIERIEREQPDLVLADLNMPGRDGYGVAEFVKQSPVFASRTRVVLLTGAFEPIDQARADRLGIDGVLAKPFEPQVAIDLVRRVLSQAPKAPARADATDAVKPAPAAASGYPFEPGTFEAAPGQARSTPTELDEYFKRLDEALASAGLKASPAVRDMLDESPSATGTTGTRAPAVAKKEGPMIGAPQPHSGPTDVTLGDAFSALLAAEQGEPSAAPLPASGLVPALTAGDAHVSEASESAAAASAPAPVISEALVEQVVRRVLEQMSDRLVREVIGTKVLDIAEKVVREEIERLKAHAESLDS